MQASLLDQHPEDQAMLDLLAGHVPLSLLLDLVALPPGGSQAIYRDEVADLTWLDRVLSARPDCGGKVAT